MKRQFLAILAFTGISACQPTTQSIATQILPPLHHKLEETLGTNDPTLKINSIKVVQENGHRYGGVADISVYGSHQLLKISILADHDNVIYETSEADWNSFVAAANRKRFESLDGKLSDVVLHDTSIWSVFPTRLQSDKDSFSERLEVVVPIEKRDSYWFGSGCKTHQCDTDQAAWLIDGETSHAYVIVKILEKLPNTDPLEYFGIYGVSSKSDLPPALLAWAIDNGMTEANSAVVR
jgi:hypothetical protein